MKRIIIVSFIALLGAACGSVRPSYTVEEMRTLLAIGKASTTADTLTVCASDSLLRLPIVKYNESGYYPALSTDGNIYYYLVNE